MTWLGPPGDVQLHSRQHGIQVNAYDQRVDIQRIDDEFDHALRNSLRHQLNLLGEPPACRPSQSLTWFHTSHYGER